MSRSSPKPKAKAPKIKAGTLVVPLTNDAVPGADTFTELVVRDVHGKTVTVSLPGEKATHTVPINKLDIA